MARQLAFLVADRSVLGGLRHLSLDSGAKQCIPLGCRGQHPDLSHLTHLSIGPDIALCVNFLGYLAGLRARGLTVCKSLGKVSKFLGFSQGFRVEVGLELQHPDLSHLTHLSIGPDIALCVNFLGYLAGLRARGLTVCKSLGKVSKFLGFSQGFRVEVRLELQHPDLSHLTHLSIGPDIALCVNFLGYMAGLRARVLTVCRSLGKVCFCRYRVEGSGLEIERLGF